MRLFSILHRVTARRAALAALGTALSLTAFNALAGCVGPTRLLGVNLAGAEFNGTRLPGVLNKDYVYPSQKDLAYFRGIGMNVVRVPIRWERIQRIPNAPLDTAELDQLRRTVVAAQQLDLCVLIDLHNYGRYNGIAVGTDPLPASAFTDVWLKLGQVFTDPNVTMFGLMNEPTAIPSTQWLTIAQDTVRALRNAGVKNRLTVASPRWSGAHEWMKTLAGVSPATVFRTFEDPLNNTVFEVHQYADPDYSGTKNTCVDPALLRDVMNNVTTWAKTENKRVFLGEFGTASTPECLAALRAIVEGAKDPVWLGWTYWAAGPWWGTYAFSIEPPASGAEAPQLTLLREFLPK
ncbi:glycoside hydrolase family 5 protein [Propionivibrio soli]|uniref:glycoside hydrolase family 5 protein n=1 Tax=Propionivibrio soli TaxID=2976531 RepID=UPI0021E86967|nr:glycoside hydrolase family 5 protein [Propionivibrio soli]